MSSVSLPQAVVFFGQRQVARGTLAEAARDAAAQFDDETRGGLLVFDAQSSRLLDIDWRGSAEEVAGRLAPPAEAEAAPARGRPRLGVVSREVTLLPRHWEWLGEQPGGASVTLRRLIDQARAQPDPAAQRRRAQESAYRFMTAMAGDATGFEEALRALYNGDRAAFEHHIQGWADDVRAHARELAQPVFDH